MKVQDQSAWTQAALVFGAAVAMLITAGSLMKALYVVHWLIWRVHRVMPAGLVPLSRQRRERACTSVIKHQAASAASIGPSGR